MLKDSKEKELVFFFIKLFLIWLSWKGFIHIIGEEKIPLDKRYFPALSAAWDKFNYNIVLFLADQSVGILKTMGYDAHYQGRIVWVQGFKGVAIGNYCIGVQLMYYFSMLVLISEMSINKKFIAIPIGIIITQTINIFRIVGLTLVCVYIPKYTVIFHDHIFNIIVFGTLISFYYLLVKNK
jgi:exosortase/archaeosortase family protein